MNFLPKLAAKVIAGEKTVTRRKVSENPRSPWWREKCAYRVGQDVAICPGRGKHAIGSARVVSVRRTELGWLSPAEAQMEGFVGCTAVPAARYFEAAWQEINGSYDPDALVWRVELEAL